MTLPTLVRCVVCGTEWEMDYEPSACTCQGPTGGWWQMSVDGGVWTDQAPLGNDGTDHA